MKSFTSFVKRIKIFFLLAVVGIFTLLFQAQDLPYGHIFQDENPLLDQPTRESYSHFHYDTGQPDVITDASGFDNFDIGIDYAEQNVVSHPTNPLWIFASANASPQNARYTTNGGLSWVLNNPSYPGGTCCDPWATYLGNGTLVYGSGVSGQYVYRSTNNGATWTSPVLSVSGNDRNTLAGEMSGTGPYANYVYAAITPGSFARSTDLGASWTTTYSSSNNVPGVMIAVGPHPQTRSRIAVVYVTNTGSTVPVNYTFHYSTNGGQNFSVGATLSVAGYVGTLNGAGRLVINNARTRPYPMIAMDNNVNSPYCGRLYLVYASNDPAGNGNKPDIKLQYSNDLGKTWSSWVRVNDNANPQLSDQWFPAIWCEPNTGRLYIKWYDTRENPATYQTGVWATYSDNGGQTFATNQRISNASWTYPCPACGANQNCYRGDYDGMTANRDVGFAVWWDPRNCNYQTMGAYFPDFAMKVQPSTHTMTNINDSDFSYVSVPGVKLYTNKVKFSATVSPAPGAGTFTMTFLNKSTSSLQDSLTTYPDSVRIRMKTSGGVTPGVYTVTVKANGPNGTPVHTRTISVTVSSFDITNGSKRQYRSNTSQFDQTGIIPTPVTTDGTPIYTDNFDGANDTTSLKNRGYKVYYRGTGTQGFDPTWFSPIDPPPFVSYNGVSYGYVAANYAVVQNTNNIDSWLVLPRITGGGILVNDTLSFWCRSIIGSPFPDSVRVMYSTNDSVPEGSWTELGRFKTNTTTGWERKVFRAPTSSVNGRFAIRYNVVNGGPGGQNSDFIGIDALTVERYFVGINPLGNDVPKTFSLHQNYPNPFNPTTNIRFDLPKSGNVKMTVYDISGRLVTTLVDGIYSSGTYNVDFDAKELASGIYFYKVEAVGYISIRKMILVK